MLKLMLIDPFCTFSSVLKLNTNFQGVPVLKISDPIDHEPEGKILAVGIIWRD